MVESTEYEVPPVEDGVTVTTLLPAPLTTAVKDKFVIVTVSSSSLLQAIVRLSPNKRKSLFVKKYFIIFGFN
jgi:hypothetical protein